MDWSSTTFWPAFRPLFWNLVRTPAQQRDPEAMARSFDRSAEVLGYLDKHLANRSHIAGDKFTMGDIPMLKKARPEFPALRRWFETLSERPCYRRVVMKPLS